MSFNADYKNLNQDSKNILAFHRGDYPEGITLDFTIETLSEKFAISDWEYIDSCHNFVQWILPTKRKSQFNLDAPIVHDELIVFLEKYKDTHFVFKFSESLDDMLYFMSEFFEVYFDQFEDMMPDMDHNYLRITRFIECMQLFGKIINECEYEFAKYNIIKLIIDLLNRPFTSPETRDTLIKYWTEAMGEEFYEPKLA